MRGGRGAERRFSGFPPRTDLRRDPDGLGSLPCWKARALACAGRRDGRIVPAVQEIFSPSVPVPDDSESGHANSPGTSLALPDRLAGDQPDRPLHARGRPLRALSTAARPSCRAAARDERHLVGRRDRRLARRSRPPAAPAACVRGARGRPHNAQARLSCDGAPQPRSHVQRATVAQPGGTVPALPHDPRCPRTPSTAMVECLPPTRIGRPLQRPVQLAPAARRRARQYAACPSRSFRGRPAGAPGALQRGGCRQRARPCSGVPYARNLPDPKADHVAAPAQR